VTKTCKKIFVCIRPIYVVICYFADIKSTVIYPATAKHLAKYSSQMSVMVNESPEDYERVVAPYIESSSLSRQVCRKRKSPVLHALYLVGHP